MKIQLITNNSTIVDKIHKFIVNEYPEYTIDTDCIQTANDITINDKFDVVFIDDSLGELLIPTAVFIKKHYSECKIIVLSDNIALLSDLLLYITPFGVIDKPLHNKIIHRYLEAVKASDKAINKFCYIEKGRKRTVSFSNIIYIESNREKIIVRTTKSIFSLWMKISEAEPQFPDYFVRCHNSFLVNMNHVVDCQKSTFKLTNGQEIAISRSRKDETMEKFLAFMDSVR